MLDRFQRGQGIYGDNKFLLIINKGWKLEEGGWKFILCSCFKI